MWSLVDERSDGLQPPSLSSSSDFWYAAILLVSPGGSIKGEQAYFCTSEVQGSTEKYEEVPRSTGKYREVSRSTKKYQEVPRSIKKYQEVQGSTEKYEEVSGSP